MRAARTAWAPQFLPSLRLVDPRDRLSLVDLSPGRLVRPLDEPVGHAHRGHVAVVPVVEGEPISADLDLPHVTPEKVELARYLQVTGRRELLEPEHDIGQAPQARLAPG